MTVATNKEIRQGLNLEKVVSRGQCIATDIKTATLYVTQNLSLWFKYLTSNASPRYYVGWR